MPTKSSNTPMIRDGSVIWCVQPACTFRRFHLQSEGKETMALVVIISGLPCTGNIRLRQCKFSARQMALSSFSAFSSDQNLANGIRAM